MEKFRNIIVIGASAGGFSPLKQLITQLPETIDAAVFIVLHMSGKSNPENLVSLWQKHASLACAVPADGTITQKGHLYLAPSNHHMMIKNGVISIVNGPRENRYRPSIDVLFRSAAVYYGSRVIGIVLSGNLDDGTSGMSAIKRCGGICIVQEPSEAEYSDMPQSVINYISVDYRVPVNDMSYILKDILSKPLPQKVPIPRELQVETEITEKMVTSIDQLNEIADRSDFTCPECGGHLWAIRNDPVHRYRCHTGHVYNQNTLYELQESNLEESVWVSIRILEEKRNILNLMATHAENSGNPNLASDNRARASEVEKHIKAMKVILSKLTNEEGTGDPLLS